MTNTTTTLEKPQSGTSTVNTVLPAASIELTLADRCDHCGITAQAFFVATKDVSALLFCGHHGRKYEATLRSQGFDIADHTDKINEKSESSPNS